MEGRCLQRPSCVAIGSLGRGVACNAQAVAIGPSAGSNAPPQCVPMPRYNPSSFPYALYRSEPKQAKMTCAIDSSAERNSKVSLTAIFTAASIGYPYTPQLIAGNAIVLI